MDSTLFENLLTLGLRLRVTAGHTVFSGVPKKNLKKVLDFVIYCSYIKVLIEVVKESTCLLKI